MGDLDIVQEWRVSVATYNRVIFRRPEDGTVMLALERKATVTASGGSDVHVWAQPFGGAVRILNRISLQGIVGEIRFDCERSKREQDFRILIAPSKWEAVKQYCLHHLQNQDDPELETLPDRELFEEFGETLGLTLKADQYTYRPAGFVIENNPVLTDNIYAPGFPTVRLYRIFEVNIVDHLLCKTMLSASRGHSDHDLRMLALKDFQAGGRGRINSILTLPLNLVTGSYLALPPELRYRKLQIDQHEFDESVLAILADVHVPQFLLL